jgi:glycosyltransferase involved in cell wall biosynthesis
MHSNISPLVSIIIPSYNYDKYIDQTIINLCEQSYKNIEIIIVDDGSTDDTEKVVRSFIEKDARVKYFYQENKGLSAARNFGIEKSSGQYMQFLDADDLISKEKLKYQINHFLSDETLDISYTRAFYFTDENPNKLYKTLDLTNEEWMPKLIGDKLSTVKALFSYNIMPVNAALVKRSIINKVGLFNKSLKSLEDWEYWLRCSILGKFSFIDELQAFALIRVHKTSMSQDRNRMLKLEIGLRVFMQKIITSLKLNHKDEKDLQLQNNKKIRSLLSSEINKLGFFNFKVFASLIKETGLKNFLRGYFKAINDFRKAKP